MHLCLYIYKGYNFQINFQYKNHNYSYNYGFYIGSLSESCILYKYRDISAKILRETYESIFSTLKEEDKEVQKEVLKFSKNKEFPCKEFVPYDY